MSCLFILHCRFSSIEFRYLPSLLIHAVSITALNMFFNVMFSVLFNQIWGLNKYPKIPNQKALTIGEIRFAKHPNYPGIDLFLMQKSCVLVVNYWDKFMVSVSTPIQGHCFPYHWSKRSKGVSQLEHISCTSPDNLLLLVALLSAFLQVFTYLTLMSVGQKPHWFPHEPGLSSAYKEANVLSHCDYSGLLKPELCFYNPIQSFFSFGNLDEQYPFKYCWISSGRVNCQKCLTFGGP